MGSMEVSAALKRVRTGGEEVSQRLAGLDGSLTHYRGPLADAGVSLLQAKSATLLRYTRNLACFAEARTRGKAPSNELREELVSDWAALEKMRPLERRLRPQLDALRTAAAQAAPAHRPNPAAMLAASDDDSEDEEDAADATGAYVPPRIGAALPDAVGVDARREERAAAKRERMRRGAGARAMLAEVSGAPEEIGTEDVTSTAKEDARRTKFEERNFVRVALNRRERKMRERQERAAAGEAVRGADEISGLIGFADRVVKKKGARQQRAGVDDDEEDREAKMRALDRVSGDVLEEARERRKERKRKGPGGGGTPKKRR